MKKLVCIILALLALLVIGLTARSRHQHGEVTVYSCGGERLEHYEDAEYERIGNSVVVYDGDKTIRYLNCTIEVCD